MNKQLEKAYKDLYEYLAKYPHLIPFQAHLSRAMDQADPNDPLGRIKVLSFYIQDNEQQINDEFQLLGSEMEKLKKFNEK